jgi:hypothetical protein
VDIAMEKSVTGVDEPNADVGVPAVAIVVEEESGSAIVSIAA